jgi:hypothetical protein
MSIHVNETSSRGGKLQIFFVCLSYEQQLLDDQRQRALFEDP